MKVVLKDNLQLRVPHIRGNQNAVGSISITVTLPAIIDIIDVRFEPNTVYFVKESEDNWYFIDIYNDRVRVSKNYFVPYKTKEFNGQLKEIVFTEGKINE